MNLVFLPEAEADIDRLYSFLVPADPIAAQKAMLAIDEGIDLLLQSPYIGLEMPDRPGTRELFIPFGKSAYVLRYHIDADNDVVVVVRVWHGRESRQA